MGLYYLNHETQMRCMRLGWFYTESLPLSLREWECVLDQRKGLQFVEAFGEILPPCVGQCREQESQVERILDIWETREVFSKHVISAMKYHLGLF